MNKVLPSIGINGHIGRRPITGEVHLRSLLGQEVNHKCITLVLMKTDFENNEGILDRKMGVTRLFSFSTNIFHYIQGLKIIKKQHFVVPFSKWTHFLPVQFESIKLCRQHFKSSSNDDLCFL